MIENVIWDAGGTLFNTYPSVADAFVLALNGSGALIGRAEIVKMARVSTQYAITHLAQRARLDPVSFEARFRQVYDKIPAVEQPPFPGVIDVCAEIRARDGRNFIVTHRGLDSLTELLSTHNMTRFFTDWITREDPFPRKPDPAAINAMIVQHALDRETTLLVGDRDIDVRAGRAAGIRTCYFGALPVPDGVDRHIRAFAELLVDILGSRGAFS